MKKVTMHIQRFHPEEGKSYEDVFELAHQPNENVISLLMKIQENPVNIHGEQVLPVAWDCNCLDSVCGACMMLINNVPKEACSAQIDTLLREKEEIFLAPLSKFPVVRDLVVDRSSLFHSLEKSKLWIEPNSQNSSKNRTVIFQKEHEKTYPLSKCMTCGCCVEACPNVDKNAKFMGAHAIAQVVRLGQHPRGKQGNESRMDAVIGNEGIHHCGNSHNCQKVCPQEISLVEALGKANRSATKYSLKK